MISVVVCSRLPESSREHRENFDSTIGVAYEYLRIDNTENHYGICQAYNKGTEQCAPGQPVSRDGQGIRNYQLKTGTAPDADAAKTA